MMKKRVAFKVVKNTMRFPMVRIYNDGTFDEAESICLKKLNSSIRVAQKRYRKLYEWLGDDLLMYFKIRAEIAHQTGNTSNAQVLKLVSNSAK